jgi:hypothetical protein
LLTSRSFFDWMVLTCPTASVRLLHRWSWQELQPSNPFSDSFKAKFAEHPSVLKNSRAPFSDPYSGV